MAEQTNKKEIGLKWNLISFAEAMIKAIFSFVEKFLSILVAISEWKWRDSLRFIFTKKKVLLFVLVIGLVAIPLHVLDAQVLDEVKAGLVTLVAAIVHLI